MGVGTLCTNGDKIMRDAREKESLRTFEATERESLRSAFCSLKACHVTLVHKGFHRDLYSMGMGGAVVCLRTLNTPLT